MFCGACGTQLPAGTRFCGACGAALAAPPAQPAPPVYAANPPFAAAAPPPVRQPFPPAPQPFSPPPYAAAPQWGAAAAPAPARVAGPMPPDMHWALVLVLAWFTGGLAGLIWAFKQAAFVKKLDRSSKAMAWLAVSLVFLFGQVALFLMAFASRSAAAIALVSVLMMAVNLVVFALWLVTIFGMRASLVRHYTTVEPLGLQLSGVMTFFFSILYFQYHLSRIARLKKGVR